MTNSDDNKQNKDTVLLMRVFKKTAVVNKNKLYHTSKSNHIYVQLCKSTYRSYIWEDLKLV